MSTFLKWTPRVLVLLLIGFFTVFAFDTQSFLAFIISMIPSFVLIAGLGIAWKHQQIGVIIFFILGILSVLLFGTLNSVPIFMALSFPLFGAATVFFINWWNE